MPSSCSEDQHACPSPCCPLLSYAPNAREALTDDHPVYGICLNLQTIPRIMKRLQTDGTVDKPVPRSHYSQSACQRRRDFRPAGRCWIELAAESVRKPRARTSHLTQQPKENIIPPTAEAPQGGRHQIGTHDRLRIGAGGRVDRNAAQPVLTVDLRPHDLLMHTL